MCVLDISYITSAKRAQKKSRAEETARIFK